jgi:hypothetical protein
MTTTNEIKIGDFIQGSYRYGCICGVVCEIKKSIVVIKQCTQFYEIFTLTNNLVNVTKKRINKIGLDESQKIY